MGLDVDNIFPVAKEAQDEFFVSEAEEALRPRIVVKESDETLNDTTTMQDDDELFMSISAESTYKFDLFFEITSEDSDPDIKFTFSAPTGAIGRFWEVVDNGSLSTSFAATPFGTNISSTDPGNTKTWWRVKGWVKTSNTAGNLQFRWTQLFSWAKDTTIYAGSWMEVTKQ